MPEYKFRRKALTSQEEVGRMIESMPEWARSLTAFLYLFGCRVSEALQLTREDFEITDTVIRVTIPLLKKRDNNGPYQPVHIVEVRRSAPFMNIVEERIRSAKPGTKLWPRTRQRVWQVLKKSKQDISPHVFRHDRISKLSLAGADGHALMEWAGWADLRPAAKYLHTSGRKAAEFADKVQ
ncbi:MAG: site-specific integrase [Candidatus Methanosuratincola petrocarbonis]